MDRVAWYEELGLLVVSRWARRGAGHLIICSYDSNASGAAGGVSLALTPNERELERVRETETGTASRVRSPMLPPTEPN